MLMDMSLTKFDIYQGTGPIICFESHTDSFFFFFFFNTSITQRLTQVLHKKLQLS